MTTNKYFPAILCLALMILHFFAAYPGGMSVDSFGQFNQTFTYEFSSHHPPIMSMLWAAFNFIYAGPQTMLFFHLTLLWGGVILLYYSDENNKFRWLYIIIPFLPNILSQSGHVWKDIGFGCSFFFVTSTCIFYIYKNKKPPIYVIICLLLLCFYGCAVKFQAQFILPIMVFFVISVSTSQKLLSKSLITAILSAGIIFTNLSIMNHYSTNTQSWQLRQLFDIAAIVKDLNDDSELPQYLKDYEGYSFDALKEKSSHRIVDALVFGENRVLTYTLDEDNLKDLNETYINLITDHPFLYIKHRFCNFLNIAGNWMRPGDFPFFMDDNFLSDVKIENDIKIHQFKKNYLQIGVTKYLKVFYATLRPLASNALSIILLLVYSVCLARNFDIKSNEVKILSFVVLISLMFTLTLSVTAMSADYRYYYIVRLLSLFSLPIFLKLYYLKRSRIDFHVE